MLTITLLLASASLVPDITVDHVKTIKVRGQNVLAPWLRSDRLQLLDVVLPANANGEHRDIHVVQLRGCGVNRI